MEADTAPPEDVAAPIRKLLRKESVQVYDTGGELVLELWFRAAVPVKATDEQIENGLTYDEVPLSTVIGVVRFPRAYTDYRKQTVKEGTYTLRFAAQPPTGEHAGTAPYTDFCLLCPAADDTKPDLLEAKKLHDLSAKVTKDHPSVMVVFPGSKDAGERPKVVDKGKGHHVLFLKLAVAVGAKKATLPFGLTVAGASAAIK
jgi:hypothetical protein